MSDENAAFLLKVRKAESEALKLKLTLEKQNLERIIALLEELPQLLDRKLENITAEKEWLKTAQEAVEASKQRLWKEQRELEAEKKRFENNSLIKFAKKAEDDAVDTAVAEVDPDDASDAGDAGDSEEEK